MTREASTEASTEVSTDERSRRSTRVSPVGDTTASAHSMADLETFWGRVTIGWHTVYLGLIVLLTVIVGASSTLSSPERLTALITLGAMAGTYVLLGSRVLRQDRPWWGLFHLAVSWGCLYVLLGLGIGDSYVLLFALIPHIWAMLALPWAVPATVVFLLGIAVVEVGRAGWSSDALNDELSQFGIQTGITMLLGLFVTGIFVQAEKRAELIDELERTRSELARTEHARGALAERERLAHEIHDTLAQGFTSVLTLAQAVEVTLDRDTDAARERLTLLKSTARENLAEARALVGGLGPVGLQGATLAEAVRRAAERFESEVGVPVQLEVDGDPQPLPANAEVVLLRTTQEALTNVRRHAGARHVRLALRFRPGATIVAVVDDGRGFDPAEDGQGFGLRGMRARVEEVGGTLEVVSAPGAGTTVRATLI